MKKNEKVEDKQPAERRPYTKPAIVSGEVFETMALSCVSGAISCSTFPAVDRS